MGSFTIDDLKSAIDKVIEYRRDHVMDILSFADDTVEVNRDRITLGTVLVMSDKLITEYPYLANLPFVQTTPFLERNKVVVIYDAKSNL